MKTMAIIGGGKLSRKFIDEIGSVDYIIGVDRGAWWLADHEITADLAIGDFDSVSIQEAQIVKKNSKRMDIYPKQKDKTDLELAVDHAIRLQPKEVRIYGAVGGRLDHSVANILLLERLNDAGILGVIMDETNEARMVDKSLTIKKNSRFQYVSIVPVTESIHITLIGFVYNLSRRIIRRGETLGISNEIRRNEAMIKVHSGKALVIRSKD